MREYSYYPGCSIRGTGKVYEESLFAVCEVLGIQLHEIKDWNCCGATAYMNIDEEQAIALAGRNLALAEERAEDIVAPCNACYLVLNKTQKQLNADTIVRARVRKAMKDVGLKYEGKSKIRHPLEIFVNDIGLDEIARHVRVPLKGLKVAPYYGCQIVRPYAFFDSQHNPTTMDDLLRAIGAEVIDYPFKTRCCGGSQTGTLPDVGTELVHMLLQEARERGADAMTTICPLCEFNLEAYQDKIKKKGKKDFSPMPVTYVTQLMALAFGLSRKQIGFRRAIVPFESVVKGRLANASYNG